ncbi:metaxin-1-like [Glandiceps talaboti]
MATMEMDCWKGDWGLPSVDTNCLIVMTYAKFAGAPIKMKRTNNPWWSQTGELPVFRSDGKVLHEPKNIIKFLNESHCNPDQDVPKKEHISTLAYASLLEERLLPALLHTFWVDSRNYVEFTRTWYAKAMSFPFSFFIPGQLHKKAVTRLESSRGGKHIEEEEMEGLIYKDAKECLNLLSAKLGDKDYFYGDTPTSVDAYIFGYIAPLYKIPFPNSRLQVHLKGCQNLCSFCNRILQIYFPPDPEDNYKINLFNFDFIAESPKPKPEEKPSDPFDDPHKRRNQILSVGFAMVAMVAYALLSGLVQIEVSSDDDNFGDSRPPQLETFEFEDDDDVDDEDAHQ